MKKKIILSLATGMGLGYSPFASGTVGSLPGFLLVWIFSQMHPAIQVPIIACAFFAGVMISQAALQWFDEKDPGAITIDEIVSLPVTFFLIPLTPLTLIVGFILNRFLDIVKPPPAYQSQSLSGGWGIMTDDMISGIYSNLLMHLFLLFVPIA